jgi:hypothetical protein
MAIGLMTTALAGALLAALFFALKPRASTRAARWRAAVVLFAAALVAGAAAYGFTQGESPLLRIACAFGIAGAGVTVLLKGRQPLR